MPFIPGTPESLLARSDSKNPASTCRGLTSAGLPCRRPLSNSTQSSPATSPRRGQSPGLGPSTPESYCWQHKEQHAASLPVTPQRTKPHTIKERTSVDTLIERLDLLEVEQKKERKQKRKPESGLDSEKPERHRPKPQKTSNLLLLCCIGDADEKKRAPRPVNNGRPAASAPAEQRSKLPANTQQKQHRQRPPIERDPLSQTGEFLALIPKTASPQTTALLLAELAKPISANDEEGFIYMFWLTPESMPSEPASEAASSLLAPPSQSRPNHSNRRTSDVLNSFATTISAPNTDKKTILLKIGRAANVQRRLNQWTRQCGYNLSLIRYYPYHPSTLSEVPKTPRKVPNVHKVERLIHLELNSQRMKGEGKCSACGREHKEWFEVEAGREAVRRVDEVIRRWADWAERDARR